MKIVSSVPSHAARVASLCGFLDGISYLNKDRRSDFAEAFVINAHDDRQAPAAIRDNFSHLAELTVKPDPSFRETMGQLERDIASLLLVRPHVEDDKVAQEMRSYLSFKIMDRLDDILNDWQHLDEASTLHEYDPPKRFIGMHDGVRGQMIFYLLRSGEITFVLYFLSSTERF